MEGNALVIGTKRSIDKGCFRPYSYLCNELFKFLGRLCDELEDLMARFWWSQKNRRRKYIRWVGISCASQNFKVGWVLKTYKPSIWPYLLNKACEYFKILNSLLHKFIKAKYFPKCDLFEAKLGHNLLKLERVFGKLRSGCIEVVSGALVMVNQSIWSRVLDV